MPTLFPLGSHFSRKLEPSFFLERLSSRVEDSHFLFLDTLEFVSSLSESVNDLLSILLSSSSISLSSSSSSSSSTSSELSSDILFVVLEFSFASVSKYSLTSSGALLSFFDFLIFSDSFWACNFKKNFWYLSISIYFSFFFFDDFIDFFVS